MEGCMTNMCDSARDLAELGYPVFPCKPNGKTPLVPHGFKQATRDERQILHWWDRWPTANIAIACGAAGIAVIDIDPKAGADPSEVMAEMNLGQRDLVVARTGAAPAPDDEHRASLEGLRGAHLLFRGDVRTGPLSRDGVEIRARGAYIVAAPSVHPSGVSYHWHKRDRPPPVADLPPLPEQLYPRRVSVPPTVNETLKLGRRHEGLKDLAVDLVRRGVVAEDLLAGALLEANRQRCEPPIDPPTEVRSIARWAAGSDLVARVKLAEHSIFRRQHGQDRTEA